MEWPIDTMEEFVENFYSFEYYGNLHSTDDTNDNDDEEYNDHQTITLENEHVENEMDESEQLGLEIDKNSDVPIVIDDEKCA